MTDTVRWSFNGLSSATAKSAVFVGALMLLAPPRVAHASGPPPATATPPDTGAAARLSVDTSELGTVGPVVRQRMLERGGQVFRDAGVAAGGAGDPRVSVVVRNGPDDEGFAFEIQLEVAARSDAAPQWNVACELCTETELIDRVAEELEKVTVSLVTLATTADEAASEPLGAAEAPSEEGPAQPPAPTPERDNPGLHRWTKAGIGAAVAGVVVAGVGVGLVLLPPKPLEDDPLQERFTQPPGYALLAVGGAALVTGAVLIGLGVSRSKAQRVAVSPSGVTVRF